MNYSGATCLLDKLSAEPHCPERLRTQWTCVLAPLGGSIAQWGKAVFSARLQLCITVFLRLVLTRHWNLLFQLSVWSIVVNKEAKRNTSWTFRTSCQSLFRLVWCNLWDAACVWQVESSLTDRSAADGWLQPARVDLFHRSRAAVGKPQVSTRRRRVHTSPRPSSPLRWSWLMWIASCRSGSVFYVFVLLGCLLAGGLGPVRKTHPS